MHVYCLDDHYLWGRYLRDELMARGGQASLFRRAKEVPNHPGAVVFLHMDHHPDRREHDKQLARELSLKSNVKMVPSWEECRLYDDKWLQYQRFHEWMPKTFLAETAEHAEDLLRSMEYPFISKSRKGAGSSNVRFVTSPQQAAAETAAAFGPVGLPIYRKQHQRGYGMWQRLLPKYRRRYQRGYVMWQQFLPNNANDWRVVLLDQRFGMIVKRSNRDDVPFASGSGRSELITATTPFLVRMLNHVRGFARAFNQSFVGVDIVLNEQREFRILETTTGWPLKGWLRCRWFDGSNGWESTQYEVETQFALLAEHFVAGGFGVGDG